MVNPFTWTLCLCCFLSWSWVSEGWEVGWVGETRRVWHLSLVFLSKGPNNVNASKFATFATCRKCNKNRKKRFQSPCAVSEIQNNFNPTRNSESARRNAPDSVHGWEIRDIKCKTGQPNAQSASVTLAIEGPKCRLICLILVASRLAIEELWSGDCCLPHHPNSEPELLLLLFQRVSVRVVTFGNRLGVLKGEKMLKVP